MGGSSRCCTTMIPRSPLLDGHGVTAGYGSCIVGVKNMKFTLFDSITNLNLQLSTCVRLLPKYP
jgi:hypothetical protein